MYWASSCSISYYFTSSSLVKFSQVEIRLIFPKTAFPIFWVPYINIPLLTDLDCPQFLLNMSAFFCEYSLWDSFLFYTCYTQTQKHCQIAPQNSCMNLHSYSRNVISLTSNISAYLSYYHYYFSATLEIVKFLILLIWEVSLVSCFNLDFFNYEWYLLISYSSCFELSVHILCSYFYWSVCLFLTEI